jgi:hypothetical protein
MDRVVHLVADVYQRNQCLGWTAPGFAVKLTVLEAAIVMHGFGTLPGPVPEKSAEVETELYPDRELAGFDQEQVHASMNFLLLMLDSQHQQREFFPF